MALRSLARYRHQEGEAADECRERDGSEQSEPKPEPGSARTL